MDGYKAGVYWSEPDECCVAQIVEFAEVWK